jgi:hypothetical protein
MGQIRTNVRRRCNYLLTVTGLDRATIPIAFVAGFDPVGGGTRRQHELARCQHHGACTAIAFVFRKACSRACRSSFALASSITVALYEDF